MIEMGVGERMVVRVTLLIDSSTARALTLGGESLSFEKESSSLVLRVGKSSKELFIAFSAQWRPSVFGLDLSLLCRLNEPIRECPLSTLEALVKGYAASSGGRHLVSRLAFSDGLTSTLPMESFNSHKSLPKEIWRLVDFIFKFGMDVQSLFSVPGDEVVMAYIRDCLDTDQEFDIERLLKVEVNPNSPPLAYPTKAGEEDAELKELEIDVQRVIGLYGKKSQVSLFETGAQHDLVVRPLSRPLLIHSFAEVLLRLLDSFPEPVIPTGLFKKCITEGFVSFAAAKQVLVNGVPPMHYNTFMYLMSFIKELCSNSLEDYSSIQTRLGMSFF